MQKTIGYKLLSLIALSVAINACNSIYPQSNNPTVNNPPVSQNQAPTVTKAKYDQVQQQMTLSQVEQIVGKPGQSIDSSFSIPGLPNEATESKQTYYQWSNPDGSFMIAVFLDDKLVFKSQVNLK